MRSTAERLADEVHEDNLISWLLAYLWLISVECDIWMVPIIIIAHFTKPAYLFSPIDPYWTPLNDTVFSKNRTSFSLSFYIDICTLKVCHMCHYICLYSNASCVYFFRKYRKIHFIQNKIWLLNIWSVLW